MRERLRSFRVMRRRLERTERLMISRNAQGHLFMLLALLLCSLPRLTYAYRYDPTLVEWNLNENQYALGATVRTLLAIDCIDRWINAYRITGANGINTTIRLRRAIGGFLFTLSCSTDSSMATRIMTISTELTSSMTCGRIKCAMAVTSMG